MGEVEIDCIKEYFDLKDRASCGDFLFSKEYDEMLARLHTKHDPKLVTNFVEDKNVSRECTNYIRRNNGASATSTETLEVSEDMKFIIINKEKKHFLRYDNDDKTGNRILVFFSDEGAKIMFESKEWHINGTFKKCPKIFKQMLTLQVIIKGLHLNAAFIFCQNKSRDACNKL